MRICIITKYIPPASTDGIPRNRWEYARQFTKLGHEVHIITSGQEACEEIRDGIYIHQIQSWNEDVFNQLFKSLDVPENIRGYLTYSYLVYQRIKRLNEVFPIHLIESPLWDIEGYITRLGFPEIPFVVRLETTAMLLREILSGTTPQKDLLNEIETHFLQIADGYVFDSWSILNETERLYKVSFQEKPYAVIHHGIDLEEDLPLPRETKQLDATLKIVSAGRLEKRKGSDILITQIIPSLLSTNPDIQLHLVGKDSGQWDGFKEETGYTYHEYIQEHYKHLLGKQILLYGYVSDEQLDALYNEADVVLALSKYESFGLLYLEAMRKGKPIIAFNTGAVPEIFEHEKDGLIIPFDQPEKVVGAVLALKANPLYRQQLGSNALEKLRNSFSSERMARECHLFFEDLVYKHTDRRIFQVMNCLTDRDGVSNTTIDYHKLLSAQGEATQILGSSGTPAVRHLLRPIESELFCESDMVIYHYWNYCERGDYFNRLTLPKKVFFFHNITTPTFFSPDDEAFRNTSKGFKQLSHLDNFDVYVGHTQYSVDLLRQLFDKPIVTHIIPPWIDSEMILSRPFNQSLATIVRNKHAFHIIFVGSIAPHKKQNDLIKFFHYYVTKVNQNSHLTIIGGGSAKYTAEVVELVKQLNLQDKVTITGKVSDEDLYAYYRTADLYLSMSEHEGFGVPLAEAMAFAIPIAAYDCTAIAYTVGQNGCLFREKQPVLISQIVEKLRNNESWREQVLHLQHQYLQRFSKESIAKAFVELQQKVNEAHFKRITTIKKDPHFLLEDFIYHHDDRLKKKSVHKLIDNQFLFFETSESIAFEEEFCDLELSFLSHQWSGKVNVQIDDYPHETFDLFSGDRKIKTIRPTTELEYDKYRVKIWPAGERNPSSKGTEVLFQLARIGKPFQTTLPSFGQSDLIETDLLLEQDTTDFNEEKENKDYLSSPKVVRQIEEVGALSDKIDYKGNWSVKDEYFKFTIGSTEASSFAFTGSFTKLALTFIRHAWSGMVEVTVDHSYREVIDLYNAQHEQATFRLKSEFSQKEHQVTVRSLPQRNKESQGNELFFKGFTLEQQLPIEVTNEELAANYKISVIINTLDRDEHLEKLLKELEKQTYPFFEIVAVNGPSKDRTAEILERYKGRIKTAHCPEANLSWSRNIGIENAAGNYVAFIDDDALPCDEYWIENFVHFIVWKKNIPIGAVGGPVKHRNTDHYEFKNGATSDYGFQIFREEELRNHNLDGYRWVQGVPGGNNIVLKKALYEIGGFDERFIYYLDETDMCIRLARNGYTIINNPVNYIKHFKAPSKVRKSAYDIKWDIIARSDMFYALKNGADMMPVRMFKAIKAFRRKHFYQEIKKAYAEKVISKEEYKEYQRRLKKGFNEGLKWGLFEGKQKQFLKKENTEFLSFHRFPENS